MLCVLQQNTGPHSQYLSKILLSESFSGAAGAVPACRGGGEKSPSTANAAREHQHLVFPKVVSFNCHAFLPSLCVTERRESTGSLVIDLRHDSPLPEAGTSNGHLCDRADIYNSISIRKGVLLRAVPEGLGLLLMFFSRKCSREKTPAKR